jgi:hypothetical protein
MSILLLFSLAYKITLNHYNLFKISSNLLSKSLLILKVVINPLKPLYCSILTILAIICRDGLEIGDLSVWLKRYGKNRRERVRVRGNSYSSPSTN